MKKDTLLFFLPEREKNWKEQEILEEIYNQKINFIKRFNYEPEYINILDDIDVFLASKQYDNVVKDETSFETIFGMKIEVRFKDNVEYVKDNEAICIEEQE